MVIDFFIIKMKLPLFTLLTLYSSLSFSLNISLQKSKFNGIECMIVSTFPKNDITFEYYPNTKIIKSTGRYNSKGNKIGYWKYYYSNGQLESKGHYKRHSNHIDYQCKLRRKNGYENRKQTTQTGWWKYYSEEGKLIKKVKYEKDWVTCYECTLTSKIKKEISY
jgi:hypothetical protein